MSAHFLFLVMKISDVIKIVKSELAKEKITEESETLWLISETLNVKFGEVKMLGEIGEEDYKKIIANLQKRKKHMPLDYIVGKSEFFGLTFKVNQNCLIPRPETELLVEEVLKVARPWHKIVDIGTGSGAIAISVKKNINAKVVAVDISSAALAVAKENAKNNATDIEFLQSDLYSALKGQKFDIIISNPPYIRSKDIAGLDSDVRDYEPHLALDGGESGLDFYKRLTREMDTYLNVDGYAFFEVGYDQAQQVKSMFSDNYEVEIIKDYAKIQRIIKARRTK